MFTLKKLVKLEEVTSSRGQVPFSFPEFFPQKLCGIEITTHKGTISRTFWYDFWFHLIFQIILLMSISMKLSRLYYKRFIVGGSGIHVLCVGIEVTAEWIKAVLPSISKRFLKSNFLKLEVVDDEWEWFPFARIISHLQRATFNSLLRVVGQ